MTKEEFINRVKEEQEELRAFLLTLCCGNREDAWDIAQDSLIKAYLSSSEYKENGRFRAWLFKIAYNTFLNHRRGNRYRVIGIGQIGALESQDTADACFAYQPLYLALRTLSPKERSAVTLFYLMGYSIREISRITEDTEDAIRKQLSRGREKLKERLER